MRDQLLQTRAAVTVAEMARMVSLSRARFYQLVAAGVFPSPVYHVSTRRPIYVESLQTICLEVRRRNCGANGRPVLFYAKGHSLVARPKSVGSKPKNSTSAVNQKLLDGLVALGLPVTASQVAEAMRSVYPRGTTGVDQGEVLRSVFLHLNRRNTTDNVRR